MIIMGIITPANLEYGNYRYPGWTAALGWFITLSSVAFVPAYAIYRYCMEIGSPKQVSREHLKFDQIKV